MPPLETIRFHRPLRSVRLASDPAPDVDWDQVIGEREKKAYERGRVDGERALSEQLLRQRSELLQMHKGVLESLRQALPRLIQQMEGDLTLIALEAARRLVAGIPITHEMVAAIVREALGQVEDTTHCTILLHEEDLALLKNNQSPILEEFAPEDHVRFSAAEEVTRGGCIIQTHFGVIDARRETKINQLQQALTS
jgi:flagellar assembly protein FliH